MAKSELLLDQQNIEKWITTKELAVATGLSERWFRKIVNNEGYTKTRYIEGTGRGGKIIQIAVSCLPAELQEIIKSREPEGLKPEPDNSAGTEAHRMTTLARLKAVKEYEAASVETGSLTDAAVEVAARNGIDKSTLYRWIRAYKEEGRAGLMPSSERPGKKSGKRGSDRLHPEAYDYLLALYLDDRKRSVAHCYELLSAKASLENWKLPNLRTVQRIIRELPEAVKITARDGAKAVYDKVLPYTHRNHSKIMSNQVWVGDHFRCDFFVKSKNGKWLRPWLTAWLDMRSRKFISWQICESPSGASIISSFAKAALDPTIGLPKEIYIDNGRDYSSKEFAGTGHRTRKSTSGDLRVKTMLESLDVKVHFALPANGRAKVIEREFRVVAEELCKEFPTWCGAKKDDRPEDLIRKMKEDLPCLQLTLDEAAEIMGSWLRHVKNKRPSKGKGRVGEYPDQTFEKYRMPYRAAKREAMQLLLMRHSQPLTVRNGQVTFKGKAYFSDELVVRYGDKVYVRYNDEDMSSVTVWDLEDRYITEARMPQELPGVGADKEELSAEMKRKRKARRDLYDNELLKIARRTPVISTDKYLDVLEKIAGGKIEPQQPKIIEPLIAVGENIKPPEKREDRYDIMQILSRKYKKSKE